MTKNDRVLKGFLGRLLKSQSGNVLAMVAAGVIPLLGLLGGGIDMSRIFLTKNRLQFACDSGALAGRKMMAGGAWNANSNKANTTAENIFNANFVSGSYGSTGLTKAFSENAGNVTGTASATVPMAIMKVFGFTNKTIAVTCSAEMRIPNTDVMFVLDNTGSMGSKAVSSDTMTKMNSLKLAVKCFYEALAKIDIDDANCGSTPSGGNSSAVQLRFGFVPYSVNVNVGRLLKNEWVADSPWYQSRKWAPTGTYTTTSSGWYYVSGDSKTVTMTKQSSCPSSTATYSNQTTTVTTTTDANGAVTTTTTSRRTRNGDWISNCSGSGNKQSYDKNTYTNYVDENVDVKSPNYAYYYAKMQWDVSSLKAGGSNWNSSVTLPVGVAGANVAVDWDGCIEERKPFKNTSGDPTNDYSPIPASAYDMDIDSLPTSDPDTQWKPLLPGADFTRWNSFAPVWSTQDQNSIADVYAPCPAAAKKLQEFPTSAPFKNYVNSLVATGNTYHDIGLIWGARLMSPTGIFGSENAFTPEGGQIERHMIFMTDGDTQPLQSNYAYHGLHYYDRRQTSDASAPSENLLTATINARTTALCTAIKNKNITLWVISFGPDITSDTATRLQNCASPGRFYTASNSAALIAQFKSIADQISQLRLTN